MKTTLNTLRKVDSDSTSMPAISASLLNTSASANVIAATMPGPSSVSRLCGAGDDKAVTGQRWISVPEPRSVNSSSSTACGTLPSRMTTPSTPFSSA